MRLFQTCRNFPFSVEDETTSQQTNSFSPSRYLDFGFLFVRCSYEAGLDRLLTSTESSGERVTQSMPFSNYVIGSRSVSGESAMLWLLSNRIFPHQERILSMLRLHLNTVLLSHFLLVHWHLCWWKNMNTNVSVATSDSQVHDGDDLDFAMSHTRHKLLLFYVSVNM